MRLIAATRRWYRHSWRGYRGDVIPLRCRLGAHDWSPPLLRDRPLRICRNCLEEDPSPGA